MLEALNLVIIAHSSGISTGVYSLPDASASFVSLKALFLSCEVIKTTAHACVPLPLIGVRPN
jgi:hypothetical protein